MKLLDLFCGAGGAATGYHWAGFDDITGVDHRPQKRYPFTFVHADAMDYARANLHRFDFVHASPPCQAYSALNNINRKTYPEYIAPLREMLQEAGVPYVMENVTGAPLVNPITLCGTMFRPASLPSPSLRVLALHPRPSPHLPPRPRPTRSTDQPATQGRDRSVVNLRTLCRCRPSQARDAVPLDDPRTSSPRPSHPPTPNTSPRRCYRWCPPSLERRRQSVTIWGSRPMATRFYLPASGSAPASPAYDGAWDNTTDAARLPLVTTKTSTAMANAAISFSSTADVDILQRQWVSEPLAAQTITAQTVKLQIRGWESNSKDTQYTAICIRVVSNDGSTVRGTLVSLTRDGTEFATSLTNRSWSGTCSEVTASANDRLVVELGLGGDPWGNGNASACYISIGDDSATDLPENDTETSAYNPWLEFANDITFASAGDTDALAASDIASTPAIEAATFGQVHTLDASDIASTPALDTATFGQVHALDASDIAAATTVDTPAVADVSGTAALAASDIALATTVDTPTFGQTHALDVSDLASTPAIEAATFGQVHALDVSEISAAIALQSPTFTHVTPPLRTATPHAQPTSTQPPAQPDAAPITDPRSAILDAWLHTAAALAGNRTATPDAITNATPAALPTLTVPAHTRTATPHARS